MSEFAKGDRVVFGPEGIETFPHTEKRFPGRAGTVVRVVAADGHPVVRWDGNKGPDAWGTHPRFLALAPEEAKQ